MMPFRGYLDRRTYCACTVVGMRKSQHVREKYWSERLGRTLADSAGGVEAAPLGPRAGPLVRLISDSYLRCRSFADWPECLSYELISRPMMKNIPVTLQI